MLTNALQATKSSSDLQLYISKNKSQQYKLGNERDFQFSDVVEHYWFSHYKRALYQFGANIKFPAFPVIKPKFQDNEFPLSQIFIAVMKLVLISAKNSFFEIFQCQMNQQNVEFVLTVPASAKDQQKQFMRCCFQKAAEELRIALDRDSIIIVIEPEAALFYQISLNKSQLPNGDTHISVVDLGGGTYDLSQMMLQKQGNECTIKILQESVGGVLGGSNMDDNFYSMIESLFHFHQNVKFSGTSRSLQLMNLFNQFQSIKCQISPQMLDNIAEFDILSFDLIDEQLVQQHLQQFKTQKHYSDDDLDYASGVLFVSHKVLLEQCMQNVQLDVKSLAVRILNQQHPRAQLFFPVGGLSQNREICNSIQTETGVSCIPAQEPSIAILKGALLYDEVSLIRRNLYAIAFEQSKFVRELKEPYQTIAQSPEFQQFSEIYRGEQRCVAALKTIFKFNEEMCENKVSDEIEITPFQISSKTVFVLLHVLKTEQNEPELFYTSSQNQLINGITDILSPLGFEVQIPESLLKLPLKDKRLKVRGVYNLLDASNSVQFRWKDQDPWTTVYLNSDNDKVKPIQERYKKTPQYDPSYFPHRLFCYSLQNPDHFAEIYSTPDRSCEVRFFASASTKDMFFYPCNEKNIHLLEESGLQAQIALITNLGPCQLTKDSEIQDLYRNDDVNLFAYQSRLCILMTYQISQFGQQLKLPSANEYYGDISRTGLKSVKCGSEYIINADLSKPSSSELKSNIKDLDDWLAIKGLTNQAQYPLYQLTTKSINVANDMIQLFDSLVEQNFIADNQANQQLKQILTLETPSEPLCLYCCDDNSLGKYPFNKYFGNIDQQDAIVEFVQDQVFYCLECINEQLKNAMDASKGKLGMVFKLDDNQNFPAVVLSMLMNGLDRGLLMKFLTFCIAIEANQLAKCSCPSHPQTQTVLFDKVKEGRTRPICLHCGRIYYEQSAAWLTEKALRSNLIPVAKRCPKCDELLIIEGQPVSCTCFSCNAVIPFAQLLPPKGCPSCKNPGNKVSGCNRITCVVCKKSWCYHCGFNSPVFETTTQCYTHLQSVHGGYY